MRLPPLLGAALLALAGLGAVSCTVQGPSAAGGTADLRGRDWSAGPVALAGEWTFEGTPRTVPDTWEGTEAGGQDGRGHGTYRVRLLVSADAPPLALRYGTAATALSIRAGGTELARVGNPDPDPGRARSAYAPGTVRLPRETEIGLEITVSNHEYRMGGLWSTPSVGPAPEVEHCRWLDQVGALCLATALGGIGAAGLLLFAHRRKQRTFLHLGIFSLLVALRALVTGEYALVSLVPGVPFDLLIRLEYLTAFLPLPSAVLFFGEYFPGLTGTAMRRFLIWPSWAFSLLALVLPLDLLTRSILWFYPAAIPALVLGTGIVVRRILSERQGRLLLAGVGILAAAGLADMVTAAFLNTTGSLVPWGLGVFVVLQAATLARRFLRSFDETEALLAEKELLVKEIHHRVKNSLQLVASLVSLQANRLSDPAQKPVFQALRRRIIAVASVHEKLYGQAGRETIEVGGYLRELLRLQYPGEGDGLGTGGVVWEIHADPLTAGIDFCIDAGIILTELVGNAHKHALEPRGGGKLEVDIRIREGRLTVEVADDGPGFPPGFRPGDTGGLGFRLIEALLERNDGTLALGPGSRVRAELRVPSASD